MKNTDAAMHQQDIDFLIVKELLPYLTNQSFIDIGAEKGTFSKLMIQAGLKGVLFEPLPEHLTELEKFSSEHKCILSSYAIDETDGERDFFIACDQNGHPLDYYHSLQKLNDDSRVHHNKTLKVKCRSLNSLLKEGLIKNNIGIIKTDTEGNDLRILKGMDQLKPEIIVCEFFMPGIYSGWEEGCPFKIIEQAKTLGFEHCIAIKRIENFEFISLDNLNFIEKEWGNLIFINNLIFEKSKQQIIDLIHKHEITIIYNFLSHTKMLEAEINILSNACKERLSHLNQKELLINQQARTISEINQQAQTIFEFERVLKEKDNLINLQLQSIIKLENKLHDYSILNKIIKKIKKQIKKLISPKLGKLNHHLPIEMVIPNHYHKKLINKEASKISIVTPSYNQALFLEKTIQSIISQDYPNLEYVIQDGGSTDETCNIVKKYAASLKHFESIKDNGQSHALNLGFRHTTGEIMCYLNSDDLLLPGSLDYIANYFSQHPNVDVVYGHRILIDENNKEIGRWVLPPHSNKILSWADYIPQETLFWRRRIWEKAGAKIDENFSFAMDWDLILRFRDAGAKFVRLPRFLGAFRIHSNQKTSSQISIKGETEMSLLRERCLGQAVSFEKVRKKIRPYLLHHVAYHKLYRLGILRY